MIKYSIIILKLNTLKLKRSLKLHYSASILEQWVVKYVFLNKQKRGLLLDKVGLLRDERFWAHSLDLLHREHTRIWCTWFWQWTTLFIDRFCSLQDTLHQDTAATLKASIDLSPKIQTPRVPPVSTPNQPLIITVLAANSKNVKYFKPQKSKWAFSINVILWTSCG